MNTKPLVSIVTPCYNGENKVNHFLDSILNQTYTNIELIFVNDGSVDRTEEIWNTYQPKLETKGMKCLYIYQQNAGQAAALNQGLKLFTGKYLTWPDSDDILDSRYVEKKVEYLESHPEKNMVINPICHVSSDDLSKEIRVERRIQKKVDHLFSDFINGVNIYYPPGGYMITAESFLQMYPERQICVNELGQNIQMLLPIAYMGKYGYIDDVLYKYVIYSESHAHKKRTFEQAIERSDNTIALMDTVMKSISMPQEEYQKYKEMLEHEKWRRHFYFSIQYRKKQDMNQAYKKYKRTGTVMPKIFLLHIVRNIRW